MDGCPVATLCYSPQLNLIGISSSANKRNHKQKHEKNKVPACVIIIVISHLINSLAISFAKATKQIIKFKYDAKHTKRPPKTHQIIFVENKDVKEVNSSAQLEIRA